MRTSTPRNLPIGKDHPRIAIIVCAADLPLTRCALLQEFIAPVSLLLHVDYKLALPATACVSGSSISSRCGSRGLALSISMPAPGLWGSRRSAGASHVWLAEDAKPALATIRQNLAALKIVGGFTLEDRGVGAMLQRLDKLTRPVDIVFLDPPYEAEAEYTGTLNFLGSIRGSATLAPDVLVIAEHSSKAKLAGRYGKLEHTRLVKQGDAALSFFRLAAAEQSSRPDEGP